MTFIFSPFNLIFELGMRCSRISSPNLTRFAISLLSSALSVYPISFTLAVSAYESYGPDD